MKMPVTAGDWVKYLQEENEFLKQQLEETRALLEKSIRNAVTDDLKGHHVLDSRQ